MGHVQPDTAIHPSERFEDTGSGRNRDMAFTLTFPTLAYLACPNLPRCQLKRKALWQIGMVPS